MNLHGGDRGGGDSVGGEGREGGVGALSERKPQGQRDTCEWSKAYTDSLLDVGVGLAGGEVRLRAKGSGDGDDLRAVDEVGGILAERRECLENELESVRELVVVVCSSAMSDSIGRPASA